MRGPQKKFRRLRRERRKKDGKEKGRRERGRKGTSYSALANRTPLKSMEFAGVL
jgi:hypothetical protein